MHIKSFKSYQQPLGLPWAVEFGQVVHKGPGLEEDTADLVEDTADWVEGMPDSVEGMAECMVDLAEGMAEGKVDMAEPVLEGIHQNQFQAVGLLQEEHKV